MTVTNAIWQFGLTIIVNVLSVRKREKVEEKLLSMIFLMQCIGYVVRWNRRKERKRKQKNRRKITEFYTML